MAEFKIGRLRYTWKGLWNDGTTYNKDAVVSFAGKTYVCLQPHIAAVDFYDDLDYVTPLGEIQPRWELMINGNSWIGEWTPSTPYNVGNIVIYGGSAYQCDTPHISGTTTINLANWSVYAVVNSTWIGTWLPATTYKAGNIVKYGGIVYRCLVEHVSLNDAAGLEASLATSKWEIVDIGVEYKGSWLPLTRYKQNDLVKVSSNVWICSTYHTSATSFATTNWTLWLEGLTFEGGWSISSTYQLGDVVVYGGYSYISLISNNLNYPPSTSATQWKLLTTGYELQNDWINLSNYLPGDVVRRGGNLYVAILNNSATDPTTDITSKWQLLVPGVRWRNRWNPVNDYQLGDLVVNINVTYRCVTTHAATTTPPQPSVNWEVYFAHDKFNVLNTSGDLVVNTDGDNEALAIGPEGFLLKSVTGVPTWSNVFQTPGVFYVAPSGTDLVGSGKTWDNPYRTINYACSQVLAGTFNPTAKGLLRDNKEFIVEEALQWQINQITNSIGPFAGLTIDVEKTKRDTRFFVDALIYDISRGGNSQTVGNTLAYFDIESGNKFATDAVQLQIPAFIATLQKIRNLIDLVLANAPVVPLYQTINGTPSLISQVTGTTVEAGVVALVTSLGQILITALTEQDTSSIPAANQGATASIMVKTGTYKESLPIVVPANTALVGEELRGVVVNPNVVINTVATRAKSSTNTFVVGTTEGMENGTPVQFVSINPVDGTNSVFGGVTAGVTYYVIGASLTPTEFSVSTVVGGIPVTLANFISRMKVFGGDALSDMFYVQNGSGIRNMTLSGLLGTLTAQNAYLTRRPTGGAFVSLDPGTGPNDTTAWITKRSPYIQNVTNFGIGCVGLKIDGNLHGGGNKSIVCNDFTQILSDGIGVWTTGPGSLCEAVSVFSYYNYTGYFAENGGRIRATNGNSSYGTFGCIAEGFDELESPITASVNNRFYQAAATPVNSLGSNASILSLQYSHAGENYTLPTTNLLSYSNNFTNWSTDNNVTLVQSFVSPSGQSNGWYAQGDTSGTPTSYLYQNITIAPSGAVYTALSADSQTGGGVGATFDVTVTSTQYIVSVNSGGTGYVATNQLTINGSQLGGIVGINDLVITVSGLVNGTEIQTVTRTGVVPEGSTQQYTFSMYCKKGTASIFEVNATFSGYDNKTSSISYNTTSSIITPGSTSGGMVPTQYSATPVSSAPGWVRLAFTFYDTTALNDTLQIRLYPRGISGNAGYTLLYGAQLEIGSTVGFYLNTTTNRFTAYADFDIVGSGTGVDVVGDEIRSSAVFQTRILDSLGYTGGLGYVLASNNAQTGSESTITIAATDLASSTTYLGMRVFVNSGTGAGQYGTISSFDTVSKIATVLKESFAPAEIIITNANTNEFTLGPSVDVATLYINQPVQFIPTTYTASVASVSQYSLPVSAITGGTINTITVSSTVRLAANMPITFSGNTTGGITTGYTYYIANIIDITTIQISLTFGGAVLLLNTSTEGIVLNYPSNTNYLITSSTNNMDVNLPVYFTGIVFGGIETGTTYYINDVVDATNFTISGTLLTPTITETETVTDKLTVDSSAGLVPLTPIVFDGTGFGTIVPRDRYYIHSIVDATHITISNTRITTSATLTSSSGNQITVGSTAGFGIGNPIVFVGTTFGGLISDRVYYVSYINNATTLAVSATSSILQFNVTGTTVTSNLLTISSTTNVTPLYPIKFSGTSAGGITVDTVYYISRIPSPGTIVISSGIVTTTATATEATSNLITVTSTSGFIVNNPVIFGGPAIGGIVAGQVYYISAINDGVSFTVSAAAGGSAVTLSQVLGGNMTVRTTGIDVPLTTATVSLTGTTTYSGATVTLTNGVGSLIVKTTGERLPLPTATGSMQATTTSAKTTLTASSGSMNALFTVPTIGGISQGTTYYIRSITPGLVNTFTLNSDLVGTLFTPTVGLGNMIMGEAGWDHINPGTPPVITFDASTVYSIEPKITYSSPPFSNSASSTINQAPGTQYVDIKYGEGIYVAIPNANATFAWSSDGLTWTASALPTTATWSSVAYGSEYWMIISSGGTGGGSKVLYSNSNLATWKTSLLPSIASWSKVVYGNGKFVAITSNSSNAAYSANFGASWTSMSGLSNTSWSGLAYGAGKFVAIATGSRIAAYSTDGTSWTSIALALPTSSTWSSVTFGKGRFVAVSSAGIPPAYSLDGITWYSALYSISAENITYGDGVFVAVSSGNVVANTSEDGIYWIGRTISAGLIGAITFGYSSNAKTIGRFVTVGGRDNSSIITAGATTKARVSITGGVIKKIYEWEPGSNYAQTPTITIGDSNVKIPVVVVARLGSGALSSPTFVNNGTGYYSATTSITIDGLGYADDFQTGISIILNNITQLPRAGDNLAISGNTTIYKVTDAVALNGTTAPSILGRIQLSPAVSVANSPPHGAAVTIRTKYSQVRLTNHDFLNIGYGNFEQSNYPRLPLDTTLAAQNEVVENNYGRAFYSSTDQDGNFKVGSLFAVEQSTGIVTLSASQFGLSGLSQLRLGGVSVGNASVIITQFSTDSTFVANSDSIIPTQKAIRSHLAARLSQGGSNTFTGQLTAGTVVVGGPDKITSTVPRGNEGSRVTIPVVANIHGFEGGGWDGDGAAMAMFMKSLRGS